MDNILCAKCGNENYDESQSILSMIKSINNDHRHNILFKTIFENTNTAVVKDIIENFFTKHNHEIMNIIRNSCFHKRTWKEIFYIGKYIHTDVSRTETEVCFEKKKEYLYLYYKQIAYYLLLSFLVENDNNLLWNQIITLDSENTKKIENNYFDDVLYYDLQLIGNYNGKCRTCFTTVTPHKHFHPLLDTNNIYGSLEDNKHCFLVDMRDKTTCVFRNPRVINLKEIRSDNKVYNCYYGDRYAYLDEVCLDPNELHNMYNHEFHYATQLNKFLLTLKQHYYTKEDKNKKQFISKSIDIKHNNDQKKCDLLGTVKVVFTRNTNKQINMRLNDEIPDGNWEIIFESAYKELEGELFKKIIENINNKYWSTYKRLLRKNILEEKKSIIESKRQYCQVSWMYDTDMVDGVEVEGTYLTLDVFDPISCENKLEHQFITDKELYKSYHDNDNGEAQECYAFLANMILKIFNGERCILSFSEQEKNAITFFHSLENGKYYNEEENYYNSQIYVNFILQHVVDDIISCLG